MADIFGAAAAAIGLLDGAVRLLERIRKAYDQQQTFAEVLDQHAREAESVGAIVRTIADEDALQTAAVAAELDKLHAIVVRLLRCLRTLDPGGMGTARQLAHHLVHGTKDKETLADIMSELDRAKASLSLRMQLANVGLTRMVRDTVFANVEVIHRIDHRLAEVFEKDRGLELASLLTGATSQENGVAPLSKAEIAVLDQKRFEETWPAADLDEENINRIIVGNVAQDSAIQLLGPVGKDLWDGMRVRVEHNAALGQAVQVAYATDLETFKYILEARERTVTKALR